MTDQDIKSLFLVGKQAIRNTTVAARFRSYPEMEEYLLHRFPEEGVSPREAIARIWHGIESRPCCPTCGTELSFTGSMILPFKKYCKHECQLKNQEFIKHRTDHLDREKAHQRRRETLKKRYGSETYNNRNKAFETMLDRYGGKTTFESPELIQKVHEAMKEKYGVDNIRKSEQFKEIARQTKAVRYGDPNYTNRQQREQTMLERYGVKTTLESKELTEKGKRTKEQKYGDAEYCGREKAIKTMVERHGVLNPWQMPELRARIDYDKINQIKRERGTLNSSRQEQRFLEILKDLYPGEDIQTQYCDSRYVNPESGRRYVVDFYISSLDLFIDLNGHYSHGTEPFTGTKEQQTLLEIYRERGKVKKAYSTIAEVWGHRDVIKRQEAFRAGINRLEIFGCDFTKDTVQEALIQFYNTKDQVE